MTSIYFFPNWLLCFWSFDFFEIHDKVLECIDDIFTVDVCAINDTDLITSKWIGLLDVLRSARLIMWALMYSVGHAEIGTRLHGCSSGGISQIEPWFTHLKLIIVKKAVTDLNNKQMGKFNTICCYSNLLNYKADRFIKLANHLIVLLRCSSFYYNCFKFVISTSSLWYRYLVQMKNCSKAYQIEFILSSSPSMIFFSIVFRSMGSGYLSLCLFSYSFLNLASWSRGSAISTSPLNTLTLLNALDCSVLINL